LGSPKGFTKKGDSGNELTRHFCPDCGSPLFTLSGDLKSVVLGPAVSLSEVKDQDPEIDASLR